jgi:hypothetical protein
MIPARRTGIRIAGGTLEQQLCRHLKSFHCQEYYLNLLKCMYSHCICLLETGITLFVNQRGYIHSEPPIVICTVVVVVDIVESYTMHTCIIILSSFLLGWKPHFNLS